MYRLEYFNTIALRLKLIHSMLKYGIANYGALGDHVRVLFFYGQDYSEKNLSVEGFKMFRMEFEKYYREFAYCFDDGTKLVCLTDFWLFLNRCFQNESEDV